ncbi:hypothetical protein F4805DRAFT_412270 [Annulohypoxylon moriforme]|nr:hypothetical protein F4805DRAFT_412270 [Annulohypoxylon moriforme]
MDSIQHERPRPIGYGAIANGMGADNSLLIFRRFGSLNARNLLYMQTELIQLESRLLELDNSLDRMSRQLTGWTVPRSWNKMATSDEGRELLDLVTTIRERLEQYNNALEAQASIAALERPDRRTWKVLTAFVDDDPSALLDEDKKFLDQDFYRDLVALERKSSDPMTSFLAKLFAKFFQTEEDRLHTQGNLGFFSTDRIRGLVRILAVIISSLLPVLSIVVLYFIRSQLVRLYTIVIFSTLCSLVLTLLTDARNIEIIAGTAAYAAVQVVFISGDISS